LRGVCRLTWEFKSPLSHQLIKTQISLEICVFLLIRLEIGVFTVNQLERKLSVLSKTAEALNEINVRWAVGASLLLFIKGLTNDFRDIDIVIAEEDAEKAKNALCEIATLMPPFPPGGKFKSRHFYEFCMDGVDIDLIAGFTVVHQGTEYYFPLTDGSIEEYAMYGSTRLPLHSLRDWRLYYLLMDKPARVAEIDAALNKCDAKEMQNA